MILVLDISHRGTAYKCRRVCNRAPRLDSSVDSVRTRVSVPLVLAGVWVMTKRCVLALLINLGHLIDLITVRGFAVIG